MAGEVTASGWAERKAFAGFTDEDAAALRLLAPYAERYADDVVEALYARFLAFPETRAFFPDDKTLTRVKGLQRAYFLGLTSGDYGDTYLEDRLRIGVVHHRIGLEPRWYMGAYAVYMEAVLPLILTSFAAEPEKASSVVVALTKLIALDIELAIGAYMRAREKVVQALAREIEETSTPVVEVWEGVVAAPLIGTFDTSRAQRFMEALLEKVVAKRASVALIDVTGVAAMDSATAHHLLETVKAVKLLGSRAIFTGITPAVAETLVHLGVDTGEVVTRATLAQGLSYALETMRISVQGGAGGHGR